MQWPKRKLRGLFVTETGRKASAQESWELLANELSKGREVLPLGEPCEGFDYVTGCPGHEVADCARKGGSGG